MYYWDNVEVATNYQQGMGKKVIPPYRPYSQSDPSLRDGMRSAHGQFYYMRCIFVRMKILVKLLGLAT